MKHKNSEKKYRLARKWLKISVVRKLRCCREMWCFEFRNVSEISGVGSAGHRTLDEQNSRMLSGKTDDSKWLTAANLL